MQSNIVFIHKASHIHHMRH